MSKETLTPSERDLSSLEPELVKAYSESFDHLHQATDKKDLQDKEETLKWLYSLAVAERACQPKGDELSEHTEYSWPEVLQSRYDQYLQELDIRPGNVLDICNGLESDISIADDSRQAKHREVYARFKPGGTFSDLETLAGLLDGTASAWGKRPTQQGPGITTQAA